MEYGKIWDMLEDFYASVMACKRDHEFNSNPDVDQEFWDDFTIAYEENHFLQGNLYLSLMIHEVSYVPHTGNKAFNYCRKNGKVYYSIYDGNTGDLDIIKEYGKHD